MGRHDLEYPMATNYDEANCSGWATNGFQSFEHAAADIILAASFNTLGSRVAVCSADHRIRVYCIDQDKVWSLLDQFRGHDGEVLDVWSTFRHL